MSGSGGLVRRREFLKLAAGTAGGLAAGTLVSGLGVGPGLLNTGRRSRPVVLAASPSLAKYVDRLPFPMVAQPVGTYQGAEYYEIQMRAFFQRLHRDLAPTPLWGYNGTYPGPTIEARANRKLYVKWINDLPTTHFLPVDTTLHGAEPSAPRVRTVVHLHGGHVPPESDGGPDAWFTKGFAQTGPDFPGQVYFYPNRQQAAPLWYHDHAIGITRLNVYAGLAGLWLIRDAVEDGLPLPKGPYEIPLVIQDRTFNADGSLFYPSAGSGTRPIWEPEFFGDTILVNGKAWPYLEIEPRKYRFRIYNGSNSRFYLLRFDPPRWFHQIGSEGGLFTAPVLLDRVLLAPAERADIVVDFGGLATGTTFLLRNFAPDGPFTGDPADPPADPNTTGQVMQFRIRALSGPDTSALPGRLRPVTRIPERSAVATRDRTLEEEMVIVGGEEQPDMLLLNGLPWSAPITPAEKVRLGTAEIWRLVNLTGDTHPIHLHLVMFQVLDRRPFDVDKYMATKQLEFTGPGVSPAPNEMGWKDTVRANPGEVTRIIARYDDFPGKFVWHCHIIEHEDNEMMRPFLVVPS